MALTFLCGFVGLFRVTMVFVLNFMVWVLRGISRSFGFWCLEVGIWFKLALKLGLVKAVAMFCGCVLSYMVLCILFWVVGVCCF